LIRRIDKLISGQH